MKYNQKLKSAIIAVVENQIDANDPPEITQTLDRLLADGFSENEAKELIGNVVVMEVFEVLKAGKPFDIKRYAAALASLPELPSLQSQKSL